MAYFFIIVFIRLGTHDSCECLVELSGVARKEAKIAKVHCMIYCSMDGGGKSNDASSGEETPSAIAVDNSTLWGTYMVTVAGHIKVFALVCSHGCMKVIIVFCFLIQALVKCLQSCRQAYH